MILRGRKYVTQLKEMAARVAALQGPDGLWRAGMLDPGELFGAGDLGVGAVYVCAGVGDQ